jgi:hypothetical protein
MSVKLEGAPAEIPRGGPIKGLESQRGNFPSGPKVSSPPGPVGPALKKIQTLAMGLKWDTLALNTEGQLGVDTVKFDFLLRFKIVRRFVLGEKDKIIDAKFKELLGQAVQEASKESKAGRAGISQALEEMASAKGLKGRKDLRAAIQAARKDIGNLSELPSITPEEHASRREGLTRRLGEAESYYNKSEATMKKIIQEGVTTPETTKDLRVATKGMERYSAEIKRLKSEIRELDARREDSPSVADDE